MLEQLDEAELRDTEPGSVENEVEELCHLE
jgi:hypothetical protein